MLLERRLKLKRRWYVRRYKPGEEQKISSAMKIVYGHGLHKEVWKWFYSENPFKHHFGVADYENQIVGFMGLAGKPLVLEGKQFKACIASELGVHPNFRRQGVFTTLGQYIMNEAAKQGIDLCYGFPNEIARLGHMKYGWFDVCPNVPIYVKYLTANGLFKSRKVRKILSRLKIPSYTANNSLTRLFIEYCLLKMIARYCKLKFQLPDHSGPISKLTFIRRFNNAFDDFWKKAWMPHKIAIKRDSKYLNWRYFQKPLGKYVVLIAERDEEVIGFICLLIADVKGQKVGYIADFLTLPDEETTLNTLLDEGIRYCKRQKVDAIGCWLLGNNRYLRVLKRNAFFKAASGMRLMARINREEMEKYRPILENASNWYITLGDADFDLSI